MPLNSPEFALAYRNVALVTFKTNDDCKAKDNILHFTVPFKSFYHLIKGKTKEEIAS